MAYYNTTNETDPQLKENRQKAKTQKDIVLYLFKNNKDRRMSASMVHKLTGLNCPLTSIRRAISDLHAEGVIVKTDVKVSGVYGRAENTWKLE